jgi:predicted dehydrogenase
LIQIGLIGVGHWGPNIVRSFDLTGRAHVRWICDLKPETLAKIAARHPSSRTTSRSQDLLEDPEIDAIVVSTPVSTHFDLASRALAAKKHVLVEKPITSTSQEARELVRQAREAGRVLMVGHVFEYNATIRALKKLIDSGELGRIQYLNFVRTNLGPVRTDVNALWDLASHDVSIMSYFLGRRPKDVTARGHSWLNRDIEDTVFATFSFPGGVLANVNVSWLNPQKVRQITVVGDKKMAVWNDLEMQHPIHIYDRHVEIPEVADTYLEFKTAVVDGGVYLPNVKLNQPLQAECEHFLECVEKGTKPHSDGESGLGVVLALEAATRSMREQSRVTAIEES